MTEVLFADANVDELRAERTLPAKFRRLLGQLNLPHTVADKSVAIKMHLGGNLGYTTIHPLFVRLLVQQLKDAGAKSICVMDGSTGGATARGYTEEVLGAPVVSCFGWSGDYIREKRIGFDALETALYGGNALDVDVFIDLSHIKGHGMCGFGGAIKNIAMGCVTPKTRGEIHGLQGGIIWHAENCDHCMRCIEECPRHANQFDDDGNYKVNWHECTYCHHCVLACQNEALEPDETDFAKFQEGLARVAGVFLDHFDPENLLYINVLTDITIFCDCWGLSTRPLVPDVGIMAGRDIVATETATLDAIDSEDLMETGLPEGREIVLEEGHLFELIHGKDPYTQVRKMEQLGGGASDYEIVEVD